MIHHNNEFSYQKLDPINLGIKVPKWRQGVIFNESRMINSDSEIRLIFQLLVNDSNKETLTETLSVNVNLKDSDKKWKIYSTRGNLKKKIFKECMLSSASKIIAPKTTEQFSIKDN